MCFDSLRKKGKKQGRPGMNFDGSSRTGLDGETLSTPYAPPGAKRIKEIKSMGTGRRAFPSRTLSGGKGKGGERLPSACN